MKGKARSELAASAGGRDIEWGRKRRHVCIGQRVGVLKGWREYGES